MGVFFECLIFTGCITTLWLSTRVFVSRLEMLSIKWGWSMLSIGSIILAVLTSVPELLVCIQAVMHGSEEMAMGNILGSVVANSALVMGVCGLIKPISVDARVFRLDLPLSIGLLCILMGCAYWVELPLWIVGVLLLAVYCAYLWLHLQPSTSVEKQTLSINGFVLWFGLLISALVLFFSCYGMVLSAESLAQYWGVSEKWIGLTILAIGTSLPELSSSIEGHRRGHDDMVLGNVLGSNCFLIFGVLGVVCLIAPDLVLRHYVQDFLLLIGALLLLSIFLFFFDKDYRLNRIESLLLLIVYVGYLVIAS